MTEKNVLNRNLKLLTIIAFSILFSMQIINATWWDSNWIFRQEINISSTQATASGYQVLIILNSSNVGSNFDWTNGANIIRFANNTNELDYWIENYNIAGQSAYIWVETDDDLSLGYTMHMYYGNITTITSNSNATNTFTPNSIHLTTGRCTDAGNCNGMDNHAESDAIRSLIGSGSYASDGTGYVTSVNQNTNPYGSQDYYYMRHRFLWIPSTGGSYTFGMNSDDGSEATILPYDAYGGGLSTTHPFGAHDVIGYWYGLHGTGACGTSGTQNTRAITAGQGYWIDVIMNEWGGGQLSQMCSRLGAGAWNTMNTANFPNEFYSRTYVTPEPIITNLSNEENYYGDVSFILNNPSTATKSYVLQNQTLKFNITMLCNGPHSNSPCGNLTIRPMYNDSLTTYTNISNIFGTLPMWSLTSTPSYCNLKDNENCTLEYEINFTGTINSHRKIIYGSWSNISYVNNGFSNNWLVWIINTNIVAFNQSSYSFAPFYKNQGDAQTTLKVISNIGTNDNVTIWCDSGNCSTITQNWINGTNLVTAEEKNITFTCSDNSVGTYSAIFKITSNGNPFNESINLDCTVQQAYGPLSSILNIPAPLSTTLIPQNRTFVLNATASCVGICGNVTAYAVYTDPTWWNTNWMYKQIIDIDINTATPINYQILLELNSSNLGTDFDWSNNCNDIRFINNSNELDYWVQSCNTTTNELFVWVETDSAMTAGSIYALDLYYKNDAATSNSNVSATFRNDEIFLITGDCNGGVCDMDNHAESDTLKANIGTASMTIHGTGYRNAINDVDNPYGANDNYFSRYRLLFVPSITASYSIGMYTDDDSEVSIFPSDGYGSGFATTHPHGAHDVVSTQYATWHGNNACGANVAIEGSRTLTAGEGYWLDFVHIEGAGGEDQVMCMDSGSGYNTFTVANFPNQVYARNYVANEPTINSIGAQQDSLISTISGDTPLYTFNSQPQSCIMPEDGSCSFEWLINATGPINSSYNISVVFKSNYSSIAENITQHTIINITRDVFPTITLFEPTNGTKVFGSDNISFIWYVDDDSSTLNCSLYLNNILEENGNCSSMINTTWNRSLASGYYSWFINATDDDNNTVQSDTWNFRVIKNYSARITKTIQSENTDQYLIKIIVKNLINSAIQLTPFDFNDRTLNYGSFNIAQNITNSTSGPTFFGDILGWYLDYTTNTSQEINYSIAGLNYNYTLSDEFVIGLD